MKQIHSCFAANVGLETKDGTACVHSLDTAEVGQVKNKKNFPLVLPLFHSGIPNNLIALDQVKASSEYSGLFMNL